MGVILVYKQTPQQQLNNTEALKSLGYDIVERSLLSSANECKRLCLETLGLQRVEGYIFKLTNADLLIFHHKTEVKFGIYLTNKLSSVTATGYQYSVEIPELQVGQTFRFGDPITSATLTFKRLEFNQYLLTGYQDLLYVGSTQKLSSSLVKLPIGGLRVLNVVRSGTITLCTNWFNPKYLFANIFGDKHLLAVDGLENSLQQLGVQINFPNYFDPLSSYLALQVEVVNSELKADPSFSYSTDDYCAVLTYPDLTVKTYELAKSREAISQANNFGMLPESGAANDSPVIAIEKYLLARVSRNGLSKNFLSN